MAPVARGRASEPPGIDTPQGRLEAAASARYDPIQRFFEAVASRSGREASTEKSAFYRYTRRNGALTGWRVTLYADLLDLKPEAIAPPANTTQPDELRALREEVAAMALALARIEEALQSREPPRSSQDGAASR